MQIADCYCRLGRAGGTPRAPIDYPIYRFPAFPISRFPDYQLNRVTSWMTRLEFSCTPVTR